MTFPRLAMCLSIMMLGVSTSIAMDFKTGNWKGHPAILADGPILDGDAARLQDVGARTRPAAHGYRILVLNSPGGSVAEAMKITREIDRLKIHTVVQKGGSCDSACGAVVFISGLLRTVEEGGELGLHTCYRADTGMPSLACNESIALHAVAHGVSHGSLKGAMDSTPPNRMTKLSRQWAECWGLVRYAGSDEAGFVKIDPCAVKIISGQTPAAQATWRIDVEQGGYSAFVRIVSDYALAGQIKVSCKKTDPGALNFQVLVPGPADRVRASLIAAVILGLKTPWSTENAQVSEVLPGLTGVRFILPAERVSELLTHADDVEVRLDLRRPLEPIRLLTSIKSSRTNIRFVRGHCIP